MPVNNSEVMQYNDDSRRHRQSNDEAVQSAKQFAETIQQNNPEKVAESTKTDGDNGRRLAVVVNDDVST